MPIGTKAQFPLYKQTMVLLLEMINILMNEIQWPFGFTWTGVDSSTTLGADSQWFFLLGTDSKLGLGADF